MNKVVNESYASKETVSSNGDGSQKRQASVKITEYPGTFQANPEPLAEDQDENFEDFISPQSLVSYTFSINKMVFLS